MTDTADQRDYTICSTLPMNVKDNEYLFFYTRRDIEVYVNGELRDDFIEERDVNVPGGSIKKFYMMVPLTDADAGAEVKMVRTSEIKDGQVVPETFISTRYGAFSYLMRTWGQSFILSFIVLIFSVVVIIVSVVLRFLYKTKIDMMYGALGIAVIALWVITDSFLFPFFTGVFHVNGILNYMICFMIPFAPAIYLNSIQHGRYRKSMSHEIRTPINSILGLNEMILRENNDKVIGEYSRGIRNSGKMLLMLVNDVLDFSKIEAGKLEIKEASFRMSDMLYDVIVLVKERADEKSLELKTELTGEIPDEMISDEVLRPGILKPMK